MQKQLKNVDVFITHAWRYHAEWLEFCDQLKVLTDFNVRNFSLPWHDPAYLPSSKLGEKYLLGNLEGQIRAVDVVFVLDSLLVNKSCVKWIEVELGLAKKFGKKILLVLPARGARMSIGHESVFHDTIEADAIAIGKALENL
ncbi:TIR domain-containing protein [Litoricolaceae bacterium]|nr:TIR domain-containing protein [Litorivicinaceae bacterium]